MIDDIVLGKKDRIDECVRRIRTYRAGASDREPVYESARNDVIAFNTVSFGPFFWDHYTLIFS